MAVFVAAMAGDLGLVAIGGLFAGLAAKFLFRRDRTAAEFMSARVDVCDHVSPLVYGSGSRNVRARFGRDAVTRSLAQRSLLSVRPRTNVHVLRSKSKRNLTRSFRRKNPLRLFTHHLLYFLSKVLFDNSGKDLPLGKLKGNRV